MNECVRQKQRLNETAVGFRQFLWKNQKSLLFLSVWLLIAYGMKLFHLAMSHDTEAIINVPDSLYNSWVSMGRYGLLLVKKVLGLYRFNPYLASVLMFFTMLTGAAVWQYVFYLLTAKKEGFEKRSWIFPALFFTAPLMAEQMSFLLQSFEVALVILLLGVVMLLIWKAVVERTYWYMIPSVLLLALAFSCYQTVVPLFVAAAVACFLLYYEKQERYWSVVFFLIVNLAGAMGLYEIGNRIALKVTGIKPTSYLIDMILWGSSSFSECINNVLTHMKEALTGIKPYYSLAFPFAIVMGILLVAYMGRKKMKHLYLYALSMLVLLLTPFLMTILMGARPTYRTQIVLPFVVGFLFQYFVGKVPLKKGKVFRWGRNVLLGLSLVLIFGQANTTANMFYTEYVQYEEDVRLAVKISDRIEQLNLGEAPEKPVVFVGARMPKLNLSAYGQYEMPGHSFFEWSFGTIHGTFVMKNFMGTLGYIYQSPSGDQAARAEKEAGTMPVWPDTGSVALENDIIIVRLS